MGAWRSRVIIGLSLVAVPVACADSDTSQDDTAASSTGDGGSSGGSSSGMPGASSTGAEPGTTGVQTSSSSSSSGADGSSSSGDEPLGCDVRPLEPGEHLGMQVVSGGLTRNYNLYIPASYDGSEATPLVLNFHGFGSNAAQQTFFSDFNVEAEERGMIVAYPNGVENSWNAGACCGDAAQDGVDDVAFVRALVEQVADTMCIDPARVYAIGMSNGGFISHRLACEAADIITAIGPVAGALVLPAEDCAPSRPVPVIHFHGTADSVVPYGGNGVGFPGVEDSLQGWADRNGCDADSSISLEMDDVSCQTWDNCDEDATVTLCTLDGFDHCWPGQPFCVSGQSSETIRANTLMVDLFEQHAL